MKYLKTCAIDFLMFPYDGLEIKMAIHTVITFHSCSNCAIVIFVLWVTSVGAEQQTAFKFVQRQNYSWHCSIQNYRGLFI